MTAAMWLTWLLRSDVRAGRAVDDVEGQRAFVCWWLLFGEWEYPKVWWYGAAQVRVAMEPVLLQQGVRIPRLLLRLHQSRSDIQQKYVLSDEEAVAEYFCWYRLVASSELRAAPALPGWAITMTEAPSRRFGPPAVPRIALALWGMSSALQAVIDPKQEGHRRGLLNWFTAKGMSVIPLSSPLPTHLEVSPAVTPARRCTAVDLIGFARAEFGIGEDVRMASRALESAGIDHTITDLLPGNNVRLMDVSRAPWIQSNLERQAIKVFCMTAFDAGQLFLEQGLTPFAGNYNVGYWPWELPQFPAQWVDVYGLFHEIWAATTFQADAYRLNSPIPVYLMPPAVLADPLPRLTPKSNYQKPSRPFRFIYPFDPKSTLARKNPLAAVRAFRKAFPSRERDVELILRVNGKGVDQPGWRALRAALAHDRRIRIMDGTLPRSEAQRLLRSADCLVSPHRAEGLGRNIAEGIAACIPVLATGFSGSGDMLQRHECIASKPRIVAVAEYPHAQGLWWSEPDWKDLARKMRSVRQRQARIQGTVYIRRARKLLQLYGRVPAGERYAKAISRIVTALL